MGAFAISIILLVWFSLGVFVMAVLYRHAPRVRALVQRNPATPELPPVVIHHSSGFHDPTSLRQFMDLVAWEQRERTAGRFRLSGNEFIRERRP
jgi:pimeloyl-ACP methyl ester carboxylesterase